MRPKRALFLCASVLSLLTRPGSGRANLDVNFGDTVVRYFQALERRDYTGALALTHGAAQVSTDRMLSKLAREASAHRAKIELKVRGLRVIEHPKSASSDAVPVDVFFKIDVVGRRGWFSRVARKLSGSARFFISRSEERIVAIEDHGLMR
jgi:ketosteroid isomerase-like protein